MKIFALLFILTGVMCAVDITAGTNIQGVVNANGAGTTYVLKSGVHRQQSVVPKANDVFQGEAGTVMNGAALLTSWSGPSSGMWTATGQTQAGTIPTNPPCQSGWPGCQYPEELFFDGVRLQHVTSTGAVTATTWYFDYAADTIYIGRDPATHTVETSVTARAFDGQNGIDGVTIDGIEFRYYANPAGIGLIETDDNWTITNSTITMSHGSGITCLGGGTIITNNIVTYMGQIGISCSANTLLLTGNEIAFNNAARFDFEGTFGEAGATKFSQTDGAIIRNNYVHDNIGLGIWMDGSNVNWIVESNRTERNYQAGIFGEISCGGIIRYNVVESDATLTPPNLSMWYGAGIFTSSSFNLQIYGNYVKNSSNGIGGVDKIDRGTSISPCAGTVYRVFNLDVHDNYVEFAAATGYAAGLVSDDIPVTYQGPANNVFSNNKYILTGPTFIWYVSGGNYTDTLSFASWQGVGQDTGGTLYAAGTNLVGRSYGYNEPVTLVRSEAVKTLPVSSSTTVATLSAGTTGTITKVRGPIISEGSVWWQALFSTTDMGWVRAAAILAPATMKGPVVITGPGVFK